LSEPEFVEFTGFSELYCRS